VTASSKSRPILISVKGADFSRYPFYGQLALDPPGTQLDNQSVAVSDDLLLRLGIKLGDSIRVGQSEFRVAARVASEPDRMTTGFTLGPRVLFTRDGLAGTTSSPTSADRTHSPQVAGECRSGGRASIAIGFRERANITVHGDKPLAHARAGSCNAVPEHGQPDALIVGVLGCATMQEASAAEDDEYCLHEMSAGARASFYIPGAGVVAWTAGSLLGVILGAFAQSVLSGSSRTSPMCRSLMAVAAMLQGSLRAW
jgi:putative ABC transport system permease protein